MTKEWANEDTDLGFGRPVCIRMMGKPASELETVLLQMSLSCM